MQDLIFREADSNDLQAILDIHNSNVRGEVGTIDRGFLLTKITENELLKNLEKSVKYFVADKIDGGIVGFVNISQPKISEKMLAEIIWKDNSFKEKITSDKHFYIHIVATKPNYMSKGVARFMYESLYQKFPNSFFSAWIVSKPINNNRSLKFHKKQGFEQIGTLQVDQLLDLQNYQSILVFKET